MDKNSLAISAPEFHGMTIKDKSLNSVLRKQFSKSLGLHMRYIGKKLQYIELNFRSSIDREEAFNKEFVVFDKKICVDRTLDKDASVVQADIFKYSF
jgi:hypothetical protein